MVKKKNKNNGITIPYNFKPRDYQFPLLDAMADGAKRAVCVWHRRAGKDKTLINLIAMKAFERVGAYFYLLPTYNQGRKILWDGMDRDGFPFLGHIPDEIRLNTNVTEMKIRLKNGSLIQIIGTDKIDNIVGTNPVGCVFSEFALQDPNAWHFIRPILAENDGWAVFNYTPRGRNHAYDLYKTALNSKGWFVQKLTIEDTGVVPLYVIDEERASGMPEELVQQEYYCSFEAGIPGAYYSKALEKAKEEGRITEVPHIRGLFVDTWWDIGVGDSTAIWFTQNVGQTIHIIDYFEDSGTGKGLEYYVEVLDDFGYRYGMHTAPHDIRQREFSSGKSKLAMARDYGIRFNVAPKLRIDDGIQAGRMLMNYCLFDEEKCARGLESLRSYHSEYDEKRRVHKLRPVHDWSSHGADAWRTLATAHKFDYDGVLNRPIQTVSAMGWT